jgi:DNA-directed RNA polymerase subunit RPC12/RpoP
MDRMDRTAVVYICWSCGEDFEVTGHDGPADSLQVSCPDCGSDLVAVDVAAAPHVTLSSCT